MSPLPQDSLPPVFAQWFAARGWALRAHQAQALAASAAGRSFLLTAPTGGGKTLAGFLPSLTELAANGPGRGLHTLYISPLKALAADIARNLATPIAEMNLGITVEARTGDTDGATRARQLAAPPDMLLATPEQLGLLLAHPGAADLISTLRTVIIDELHALVGRKRGDLLCLQLQHLRARSPGLRVIGLSATVGTPAALLAYIGAAEGPAPLHIAGTGGAAPQIALGHGTDDMPWSGHSARHAMPSILEAISAARLTLVFTNTRSQAEICFAELWRLNADSLPIALHHGSLAREQRTRVEAAMQAGTLRAVVCTATLDLGIDWGDVDLVICLGAPKGAARLVQRIGRANHRLDEPSRAVLVPGNRFEVLECVAAQAAVAEGQLDPEPDPPGALDVLCQHVWGVAAGGPFHPDTLYNEVVSAHPYRQLTRADFDAAIAFVTCGGYALKAYDRFRRLVPMPDGRLRIRDARTAQLFRLNAGTIVDAPTYDVRLGGSKSRGGGHTLGQLEEWYVSQLTVGDTFLFGGEVLAVEAIADTALHVRRSSAAEPKVPIWQGAKFPISSFLAARVRALLYDRPGWAALPRPVTEWLEWQDRRSVIPSPDQLLIETFARAGRNYLVCYPFEGRIAHQSLGTLLTARLERMGCGPIGFCPTEYALSIWCRAPLDDIDMDALFAEDMLGDDLESWLADAHVMKRTFRHCAIIAGLIPRQELGARKQGRAMTISASLIYDVLRTHEPDHILLKAAWADAAAGFLDIHRLGALLKRARGQLVHRALPRVSPLAVPVMMEVGREQAPGADAAALAALEAELLAELA